MCQITTKSICAYSTLLRYFIPMSIQDGTCVCTTVSWHSIHPNYYTTAMQATEAQTAIFRILWFVGESVAIIKKITTTYVVLPVSFSSCCCCCILPISIIHHTSQLLLLLLPSSSSCCCKNNDFNVRKQTNWKMIGNRNFIVVGVSFYVVVCVSVGRFLSVYVNIACMSVC